MTVLSDNQAAGAGAPPPDSLGFSAYPDAILRHFPPVQHAFAYGSGVFDQPDLYSAADRASGAGPMVDFIFAVEDPAEWHRKVRYHTI